MRITKEQLKQIIKEELETVLLEYPDPTPDRGIPKIKGFERYQDILENEFGDYQPAVAAERHFDFSDVDQLENFRNRMMEFQDGGGVVTRFIDFVSDVMQSLGG